MIARAARILDLPGPELPLPPLKATARIQRPAAAAHAVAAMRDFMARRHDETTDSGAGTGPMIFSMLFSRSLLFSPTHNQEPYHTLTRNSFSPKSSSNGVTGATPSRRVIAEQRSARAKS